MSVSGEKFLKFRTLPIGIQRLTILAEGKGDTVRYPKPGWINASDGESGLNFILDRKSVV